MEQDIEPLYCSHKCKNVVAQPTIIGGKELLLIGGLLVSKVDGRCIKCGHEFHWSVTDQLLKSIIERVKTSQNNPEN
jgi:hypothetical protein